MQETDVWVCATVVSIIDEWWYNSCRRCTSKMEEANGELNCSKCSHKFGIFRYKIHFGVQDTSAPATLIAWNNECEPIIGKPCDALRREIMQKNSNSIELPEEIDSMIHKSYLFKVRIRANRRKFGDGDAAFSVVRMIGDENLVSKYSQWVTDKEESDFLTLLQKEEAKGKDCNEEEEVSTPVKTRNGKEKVGDNSNAKRSLMDIIEDEAGFVAQSATAMKGKAKVTEQDDEMKDIFDEE
ncbi:Unknown protein [Striga hermonthica]|uniref:Replication factor A C-terminal domain-containing protein n=1 Tax=Striga hermonthica TaxID=68872 RepID=A0A9N7MX57_STRHE|nr:Unknown protein [Striga hermonthica]